MPKFGPEEPLDMQATKGVFGFTMFILCVGGFLVAILFILAYLGVL